MQRYDNIGVFLKFWLPPGDDMLFVKVELNLPADS